VADSDVTHHTTPSVGNISTLHPLTSSKPSSIIVGNGSSLSITLVGDSVLPGPFYLKIFCLLLTWFKVSFLFIVLPLTIDALWNLTRLVCL
jgi:hypothetical protein